MEHKQHLARYQCKKCKIGMYNNGKCYADKKTGVPVEEYIECGHASKKR